MRLPIALFLTLFALPVAAQDWCGQRGLNGTEQAICADSVLGDLDRRLNAAYRLAPQTDRLRAEQDAWLGERDACGFEIFCIEAAYKDRLRDLLSAASAPPPPTVATRRPWCAASGLNTAERTVCASDILSNMDAAMEAVYGRLRATSGDQSQLDWLDRRDACGTDETCIGQAYLSRIIELGGRLRAEG